MARVGHDVREIRGHLSPLTPGWQLAKLLSTTTKEDAWLFTEPGGLAAPPHRHLLREFQIMCMVGGHASKKQNLYQESCLASTCSHSVSQVRTL